MMVWFGTMGAHDSIMFGLELKGCKNDGLVWKYIGAVRGSRSCEALGAFSKTPTNSHANITSVFVLASIPYTSDH